MLRAKRLAYRVAAPLANGWWGLCGSDHQSAKCVIRNAGELLLVRHTYGDQRRWELAGGLLRRGEDPSRGACRELGEELGLTVAPGELRELGILALALGRRNDTVHHFLLEVADREVEADPVELAEVAWFAPGALPGRVGANVRQAVEWAAAPPCVSIGPTRTGESREGLRGRSAPTRRPDLDHASEGSE